MCICIPAHLAKLILADEHYCDRAKQYYRQCLDGTSILLKTGAKLLYIDDSFAISGYDQSGEDILPYVHEYGLEHLVD